MTSNNYDAYAEERARAFASGTNLVHTFIEKPAMYALLPDLKGKNVLCMGCGTGEECVELIRRGADVVGADISKVSITYAAKHVPDGTFRVLDMDSGKLLRLGSRQFDFIYSSMTLHYSEDLQRLFNNMHTLLKPDGRLLFSVGHPLRWASEVSEDSTGKTVVMGYHKNQDGVTTVFGDYLNTRCFTRKLADGPRVTYQMRPISAYFLLLKRAGFAVEEFEEPLPLPAVEDVDKDFWQQRTKMPVLMLFLARKTDKR